MSSRAQSAPNVLRKTLVAIFALAASFALNAQAQTAPQLLPYTVKTVAGGGTAPIAAGATCPTSGFTSTDAYGDGCLATEVLLGTSAAAPGPRAAIADVAGNIYFGDYVNGIVHRVDAITGVMTAIAGGPAGSPAAGTACGTNLSTDAKGDGCLSTLVHLSHPTGLVFATNGDLYFGDYGYGEVRKVAATNGIIPIGGGVITLVAGSPAGTFGYNISNATTVVTAAQSVLDGPYSLAFDTKGDLLIADQYTASVLALNLNATGTNTVNGVPVAAGTIWKVAGTVSLGGPFCVNGTGSGSGCTFNHVYTDGIPATTDYLRNAYGIAVDPSNNLYITNEYYDSIQIVAPSGTLTTFAGINGKSGSTLTRGAAGSFAIGSPFGVASDTFGNVYFSDANNGTMWRVDAGTQSQFLISSGLSSSGGTTGFAATALPGPGVFSVSVDPNANLFFGDTEKNIVGEVASGTQFGAVGANKPTQTLDIHFAAGDSPGANAYTLTTGTTNFSLGTASCLSNSDSTVDCLLPVTATPSVVGAFSGTFKVTSQKGASSTFALTGTFVQSPVTSVQLSFTAAANCTGSTTYSTTAPITITAKVLGNGPAPPTGTILFSANGVQLGSQTVTNIGTAAAPVYGATISSSFATPATYTITAAYSGDSYFKPSTGSAPNAFTTATASFSATPIANTQGAVPAGQTAFFAFNLIQNVYTGTLNFTCSGLPAGAACVFNPGTVVATGCSASTVVALSITTQQALPLTTQYGAFGAGLGNVRQIALTFLSIALALVIALNRRRIRLAQLWVVLLLLVASNGALGCGKGPQVIAATPSGSFPVTVTINGSSGPSATVVVTLKVQ